MLSRLHRCKMPGRVLTSSTSGPRVGKGRCRLDSPVGAGTGVEEGVESSMQGAGPSVSQSA